MNINLPVNQACFDLIKNGRFKEDYRQCKPYWIQRVFDKCYDENGEVYYKFKDIDQITFYTRFTKNKMVFECIDKFVAETEWGPTPEPVIVFKLGKRIS